MTSPHDPTLKRFEEAAPARDETWYELTLIVSGASARSTRAVANAHRLCDDYLGDRYHLSIIDLHEEPADGVAGQVLAAPTLVKNRPLPACTFVGDLSRTETVLLALALPAAGPAGPAH